MQFGCMCIIAKKVYEKIRKRGEREREREGGIV